MPPRLGSGSGREQLRYYPHASKPPFVPPPTHPFSCPFPTAIRPYSLLVIKSSLKPNLLS